jgi:hypothetical protein
MMQLHVEPDLAIPFFEGDVALKDFVEKATAACATAEFLGLADEGPTPEEKETAEKAVYSIAEDPDKGNKQVMKASKNTTKYTPAVYKQTKHILDEYSLRVVDNATQIRLLVTNKLIIESENEDAKVRLRALELLGKITDVGLFTEKSEVTVTHRSSADLVNSLRAKIQKLMYPQDIQDAEVVTVKGEAINVDEELGITDTAGMEETTVNEEKPDGQ